MTNLRVLRGGRCSPTSARPTRSRRCTGRSSARAARRSRSFVTSVWADSGFVDETNGIAEGLTALREDGQTHRRARSRCRAGEPARAAGTLTVQGTSTTATPLRRLRLPRRTAAARVPAASRSPRSRRCAGAATQDTLVNTLSRVAQLIYTSEGGAARARAGPSRAAQPAAAERRRRARPVRDAAGGRTPAARAHRAPARQRRRAPARRRRRALRARAGARAAAPERPQIGNIVLSIQDDEGYKRLPDGSPGLDVLMYMGPAAREEQPRSRLPARFRASGPISYHGHTFRVFTLHAAAFPSGPLRIVVLIPIPTLAPEPRTVLGALRRTVRASESGARAAAGCSGLARARRFCAAHPAARRTRPRISRRPRARACRSRPRSRRPPRPARRTARAPRRDPAPVAAAGSPWSW